MTNAAAGMTGSTVRPPQVWARLAAWPVGRMEALIMGVWVLLQSTVASLSVASDMARHGLAFQPAEPWIWEWSGGLAAWWLLAPVLAFDARLRTASRRPGLRLAGYLLGSVAFSVAHVALMVALRHLAYRLAGWHYGFGPWPAGLIYEYRKDAFSFLLMVAGAAALRRWKVHRGAGPAAVEAPISPEAGDAATAMTSAHPSPLASPALAPGPAATPPEAVPAPAFPRGEPSFLVRTGQGDLLVRASEVDWVEAQGNYVALHLGSEVRLLRQTLTETEARLSAHGFIRTHRRALVNQGRIAAILPAGAGEPGVRLRSGVVAPLSESRRTALMRLLQDG